MGAICRPPRPGKRRLLQTRYKGPRPAARRPVSYGARVGAARAARPVRLPASPARRPFKLPRPDIRPVTQVLPIPLPGRPRLRLSVPSNKAALAASPATLLAVRPRASVRLPDGRPVASRAVALDTATVRLPVGPTRVASAEEAADRQVRPCGPCRPFPLRLGLVTAKRRPPSRPLPPRTYLNVILH